MLKPIPSSLIPVLGLLALAIPSHADETKVPAEKLPEAVKKTLEAEFPKARIVEASTEKEDGEARYEVELSEGDRKMDVALMADGTIVEVEQEVDFKDLPAAVKVAIAAKFPEGKVKKVESITKGKKGPTRYEVAVSTEVVVTAKGKVVQSDDEEQDDDDDKPKTKKEMKKEAKKKAKSAKDDDDEKEMKKKDKDD